MIYVFLPCFMIFTSEVTDQFFEIANRNLKTVLIVSFFCIFYSTIVIGSNGADGYNSVADIYKSIKTKPFFSFPRNFSKIKAFLVWQKFITIGSVCKAALRLFDKNALPILPLISNALAGFLITFVASFLPALAEFFFKGSWNKYPFLQIVLHYH